MDKELDKGIETQVLNFGHNALITAVDVNQILNHIDYKFNLVLKALKEG